MAKIIDIANFANDAYEVEEEYVDNQEAETPEL